MNSGCNGICEIDPMQVVLPTEDEFEKFIEYCNSLSFIEETVTRKDIMIRTLSCDEFADL